MVATLLLTFLPYFGGEHCEREQLLKDGKLIAHEWGTYTSFSGSDGIHLEFRTQAGEDLPGFVYNRARQAAESRSGTATYGKSNIQSMVRMETPVIYFYTGKDRKVDVSVDFPNGLITEFFPPVSEMAPPYADGETVPSLSHVDWKNLWVLPASTNQGLESKIPAAKDGSHYGYARETDAAIVRFTDNHFGDKYEKFLFYRGVGNFQVPVKINALGQGRFRVRTEGEPCGKAFLVEVKNRELRFAWTELRLAEEIVALPEKESTYEQLGEALVQVLRAQGLYEREARAMIRTWQASWFGEEGTRLFYVLPSSTVDLLLPLQINPAPDILKRVFVGRMEILTPEKEREIQALVEKRRAGEITEHVLKERLATSFGRFGEAALRQVLAQK